MHSKRDHIKLVNMSVFLFSFNTCTCADHLLLASNTTCASKSTRRDTSRLLSSTKTSIPVNVPLTSHFPSGNGTDRADGGPSKACKTTKTSSLVDLTTACQPDGCLQLSPICP